MVELGKVIVTHNPSLSITILILTPSTTTFAYDSNAEYIATVTATTPAITFHRVPHAPLPFDTPSLPPHLTSLELTRHSVQNVAVALQTLAKVTNLKAIVMDFLNFNDPHFLTKNLDKTVPFYFYYTSGVSTLSVLLHLQTVIETITKNLTHDHQQPLDFHIPGLFTISMDDFSMDSTDYSTQHFPQIAEAMRGSAGIIVNTYEAIEEEPLRALGEDGTIPPLFCVGPLISSPYGKDDNGCLSWLDSQPSQSVVFLSFGSMGCFSRGQLKEIAVGLEKSEQRFLWVVRTVLGGSDSEEQPSLEELMPEGFLERTKEKGLVVRNWAPQMRILSHDSVAGFVTHCGWNSVLEAVCEGVPMVAWPLFAEQRMNRVVMVREMKVALAVKMEKDGFVSGTELGDRVRELMESDNGKEIRQRVFKTKISAAEAMGEGGTSRVALDKLANLWKQS
ncbi:hypothetical protein VNO78_32894 [Psophocarpus tetragonolobus]|uniref:Glycosyltransferase n=1 Tax=Psophocarpus tetragonolobus TaxID=3891 RepID=A0AAN9NW26_PSOTE